MSDLLHASSRFSLCNLNVAIISERLFYHYFSVTSNLKKHKFVLAVFKSFGRGTHSRFDTIKTVTDKVIKASLLFVNIVCALLMKIQVLNLLIKLSFHFLEQCHVQLFL